MNTEIAKMSKEQEIEAAYAQYAAQQKKAKDKVWDKHERKLRYAKEQY